MRAASRPTSPPASARDSSRRRAPGGSRAAAPVAASYARTEARACSATRSGGQPGWKSDEPRPNPSASAARHSAKSRGPTPAPMRARPPSAACIAAMLSSGAGEFSGTSIQSMPASTSAGAGLDGARRARGRAGWRSAGGSCPGPLGQSCARAAARPASVIVGGVERRAARARRARAPRGRRRRAPARRSARPRGRASRARAPASSAPISRPESRARARSGARPASSASARMPKSRAARRSGRDSASSTASAKSASDQPSAPTEWRSTEACASSAKSSPVMKVREAHDLAGADMRPLGVGAGQAGDAVEAGLAREQPGDLGLLAAHHVGGARPG